MEDLQPYKASEAEIGMVALEVQPFLDRLPELIRDESIGEVNHAIKLVVPLRTAIEKIRVRLKANALAYGRMVDNEAKRLTALVSALEEPLRRAKYQIEDAERKRAEEIIRKREEEERAERDRERSMYEARICELETKLNDYMKDRPVEVELTVGPGPTPYCPTCGRPL